MNIHEGAGSRGGQIIDMGPQSKANEWFSRQTTLGIGPDPGARNRTLNRPLLRDLNHHFLWSRALSAASAETSIFEHSKEVSHGQQAGLEQAFHHSVRN